MSAAVALPLWQIDPHFGRLLLPPDFARSVSMPGAAVKPRVDPREVGIVVLKHLRPIHDELGRLVRWLPMGVNVVHNERVDVGAAAQFNRVFGTTGTTANGVITVVALANAALTIAKTDLSLGSGSSGVTTNEFTNIGLARGVGTVSTNTPPSVLGGVASQLLTKAFTASGSGTVQGVGLFDSATVVGSNLYFEANLTATAVLVSGDQVTAQITISN